jgi:hypothetical protein
MFEEVRKAMEEIKRRRGRRRKQALQPPRGVIRKELIPTEPLAVRVMTAAQLLDVAPKTIRGFGQTGDLELVRAGRLLLVNFASLKALLARLRGQAAA